MGGGEEEQGDEEEEQGGEEAEQVDEEAEQGGEEEAQGDGEGPGEWVYCAGQTAACGRTYHTRVVSPPVGNSLDIFVRWHQIGLDV